MRKMLAGFAFTVLVASGVWVPLSSRLSHAEEEEEVTVPPVPYTPCLKLAGGQEGCPNPTNTFPCTTQPPAGATIGSKCGTHDINYSSPKWDKVVHAEGSQGNKEDWSLEYLCATSYDCTVQQSVPSPVCAFDPSTKRELKMTKIALNFDDPCNLD